MGKSILLIIGIIILIPIAIKSTRNIRKALKKEKELYLKSNKMNKQL